MKRKLKEMVTRSLALVIALGLAGGAWADSIWNSESDGSYSDVSMWTEAPVNGMTSAGKHLQFLEKAAGRTVTFDVWDSMVWWNTINTGSTASPLVFQSSDGTESYGLDGYWPLNIANGDNTSAALTIKSGKYYAASQGLYESTHISGDTCRWSWGNGAQFKLSVEGGRLVVYNNSNVGEAITMLTGSNSKADIDISSGSLEVPYGNMNIGFWCDNTCSSTINISGDGILSVGEGKENVLKLGSWNDTANSSYCSATITVNLNGGQLKAWNIAKEGLGTSTINFNGGTLKALGAGSNGGLIGSGINVSVGTNGGTIDVGEYAVTIASAVSGTGTLTKTGTGTLTFSAAPASTVSFTLNAGSLVLPITDDSISVTTDVAGYEVKPTVGESTTTYTFSKVPVTWQGDEGSNWNTPGNWDSGVVPTADDDVVIPANSTITLDAAAYAATITADETVTISVSGFSKVDGIRSALKDSKWKGTLRFTGSDTSTDQPDMSTFGNSASTIEFNAATAKRLKATATANVRIVGSLKTTASYNQGSSGYRTYLLAINQLTGSGSMDLAGSTVDVHQNIYIVDGSSYNGSLTTRENWVAYSSSSINSGKDKYHAGYIEVFSGYTAGLGLGATWNPSSEIYIAGTIKVQQGADASATVATLKAPTVTFEKGATIQYTKLGTIALVNSSNEGISPSGSGTVSIAFDSGVTLADAVQLMSWAAESTPENVEFVFANSDLDADWKLTASETGLVLNAKNPVATVDGTNYTNLETALANATDTSAITLNVNSSAAIALRNEQTLTIPSGIEYTGALSISAGNPALNLAADATVSSVTVAEDATFTLPSNYALLTGENVLVISGAGWVKVADSTVYSSVAISVAGGTLDVPAGSTFKDIAAGKVYVSGTVTGTTVDAEGNVGKGSTLFTLTEGTFANATVTAWVNNADTAIHYTKNDSGVYKAGKVFYWINSSTGQSTGDVANNINKPTAWSAESSTGVAQSEFPLAFDTAVFDKADKRAIVNANMPYNVYVKSNFRFLVKAKNDTYTIGTSDSQFVVADNVSAYIEGGQNTTWGKYIIASKLIGGETSVFSASADVGSTTATLSSDTSDFSGTIKLTCGSDTIGSFTATDAFANSEAKWSIFENGNKPTNVVFPTTLRAYAFKSLKMSAYVRHTGGSTSNEAASSIGAHTTFNIGGNGEASSIAGTWPTKWSANINWTDAAAIFTQSAANTAALYRIAVGWEDDPEGRILPNRVLNVGQFLNQQVDAVFLKEMGAEIARLFKHSDVDKILTIESSGIAIATAAGIAMEKPVVIAKKSKTANVSGDIYSALVYSFTHNVENHVMVSKEFLPEGTA